MSTISRVNQILSALFSLAVYTFFIGWKVAFLIVFAVAWHEQCHLWAAKNRGLQTGNFILIPFIGGMALIKSRYRTYWDQAIVVLAGPFGGGAMAALFALAYYLTGYSVLAASAMWMLFLNVFNLLPISFMDGGQLMGTITYSISKGLGLACKAVSLFVGMLILIYLHATGLIIFILFFGGMDIFQEWKNYKAFKAGETWLCDNSYLKSPKLLSKSQMAMVIGGYLITACLWGGLLIKLIVQTKMGILEGLK